MVAATAVVICAIKATTAVAEQDDEQDNPAPVATTETVIVTHNRYLQEITCGVCRSFQVIPQRKKCYIEKIKKQPHPNSLAQSNA